MKAVFIEEFGGPEKLSIRDVPESAAPLGRQILIKVKAAGVNRADIVQRRGHYPAPSGYSQEIPGLEFAGEIIAAGADVSAFNVGERVFGITAGEAQAEYLLIDQSLAAKIPNALSYTEAAAVPEVFITAHDALFTQAGLRSGENLLIHAVASGVGLAGLQLAKAFGANVIGTSRTPSKLEKCKAFGLDHAITAGGNIDFAGSVRDAANGDGADVILDLVGGGYFEQNLKCLASKGRLMIVGLTAGRSAEIDLGIVLSKRLKITGTALRARTVEEKASAVAGFAHDVLPLLSNGTLKPNVDKIFKFADVRSAHEYLESNESFGKAVLDLET